MDDVIRAELWLDVLAYVDVAAAIFTIFVSFISLVNVLGFRAAKLKLLNVALLLFASVGQFVSLSYGQKFRAVIEQHQKVQISGAQLRAQEATQNLEREIKIRAAMLKELAPREITREKFSELVQNLKGSVEQITIVNVVDDEARSYAGQLGDAFRQAGIKVNLAEVKTLSQIEGASSVGLTLYFAHVHESHEAQQKHEQLFLALEKLAPPMGSYTPEVPIAGLPSPSIIIGVKQRPFTSIPEYRLPEGWAASSWRSAN